MTTAERNQLVERLLPRVRRLARILAGRARRGFDSADLEQVGAIALCEAAASFDPAQGSLWRYAQARVWGSMVDQVRGDWRETLHVKLPEDGPVAPHSLFERARISQAIERLPVTQRRIVRLVSVERTTRRDAARRLRITEQYAGQVLKRAKVRLREALAA